MAKYNDIKRVTKNISEKCTIDYNLQLDEGYLRCNMVLPGRFSTTGKIHIKDSATATAE